MFFALFFFKNKTSLGYENWQSNAKKGDPATFMKFWMYYFSKSFAFESFTPKTTPRAPAIPIAGAPRISSPLIAFQSLGTSLQFTNFTLCGKHVWSMYRTFPFFQVIVSTGISSPYHLRQYIPFYAYSLIWTDLVAAHAFDTSLIIYFVNIPLAGNGIYRARYLTKVALFAYQIINMRLEPYH